jgi:hypothetical protein
MSDLFNKLDEYIEKSNDEDNSLNNRIVNHKNALIRLQKIKKEINSGVEKIKSIEPLNKSDNNNSNSNNSNIDIKQLIKKADEFNNNIETLTFTDFINQSVNLLQNIEASIVTLEKTQIDIEKVVMNTKSIQLIPLNTLFNKENNENKENDDNDEFDIVE